LVQPKRGNTVRGTRCRGFRHVEDKNDEGGTEKEVSRPGSSVHLCFSIQQDVRRAYIKEKKRTKEVTKEETAQEKEPESGIRWSMTRNEISAKKKGKGVYQKGEWSPGKGIPATGGKGRRTTPTQFNRLTFYTPTRQWDRKTKKDTKQRRQRD